MKTFFIITLIISVGVAAHARTLHYGAYSVELTNVKKTSPSLYVQFANNEIAYGALYNRISAPTNSLRILYQGEEYWLGPWCTWRQYIPSGTIGCADIPNDALNRFLTLDEANKYIVPTDISQWELVSACNTQESGDCDKDIETARNMIECGCAMGTLQPGAYLFREYYYKPGSGGPYPKAQIAVFDHAVGYRSQHSRGVFENLIDTENETFQSYTIRTPYYTETLNDTNVTNMPTTHNIYVYRLK